MKSAVSRVTRWRWPLVTPATMSARRWTGSWMAPASAATSAWAEQRSRKLEQPVSVTPARNKEKTERRMGTPVEDWRRDSRRLLQRPHQRGNDRLAAEPKETKRERHRAAHLRRQLHVVQGRCETGEPGLSARAEGEPRLVSPDQHVLQAERRTQDAEVRHVKQSLGLGRKGPKALTQFISQPVNFTRRERPRQSAVQVELDVVVGHVAVGQVGRPVQHHIRGRRLLSYALAPEVAHRLLQPAHVEV